MQVAAKLDQPDLYYAALFLDELSKSRLLQWWGRTIKVPLHPRIETDHMTIAFNPSPLITAGVPVGLEGQVSVVGYAADEHCQVVLVHSMIRSLNKHPHVTVSVALGVNPVYSNELLAKGCVAVDGPKLSGVVDIRL